MPVVRLQLHHARRVTAWLLLLICLWMGSGGVLHHTDVESLVRAGTHSPNGVHRPTATAPLDACAACEWTQGLQTGSGSVCQVPPPLDFLSACPDAAPRATLIRAFGSYSPRAPPAFLPNV